MFKMIRKYAEPTEITSTQKYLTCNVSYPSTLDYIRVWTTVIKLSVQLVHQPKLMKGFDYQRQQTK